MKIPNEVKVGGQFYQIKFEKANEMDECGKTHHMTEVIKINEGTTNAQNVTFLHELIHCINNQYDESTVENIAQGLYQIIQDNKEIFK